jgi:uncharacterized protein (TIGR03435 family)
MKRREKINNQSIAKTLGLFGSLSREELEAAEERASRRFGNVTARTSPVNSRFVAVEPGTEIATLRGWRWRFVMVAASAAVFLAVIVGTVVWRHAGSFAVVETAEGSVYGIVNGKAQVIPVGQSLDAGQTVRTNGGVSAVLKLADGSRVEMRSQSELSLEQADDGVRILLSRGSVIVNAAKQPAGRHLYVQTKDVTVSVIGTVFLVNADEDGSRVAVIHGTVRVRQGGTEKSLQPGEQVASNKGMEDVALQVEIGWSREAAAYLNLLHQAVAQRLAARQTLSSQAVSGKPQFEVASIRRCEQDFQAPEGMRGGGSNSLRLSPGRLDALCMTPATLIRTAYRGLLNNTMAAGRGESFFLDTTYGLGIEDGTRVRGGPDWVRSEHYTIAAVAEGAGDAPTLGGPMLLALLESRFRLKLHVASEDVPMWALRVANGGLKIKRAEPGSCFPAPRSSRPPNEEDRRRIEEARGTKPFCGIRMEAAPPNVKLNFAGGSMQALANNLSNFSLSPSPDFIGPLSATLNRSLVLNKTGVPDTDTFDFVMEYVADPNHFASIGIQSEVVGPLGPTIFDALEKLGLTLEPTKGSREFIVIDHIERPSEN